MDEDPRWVIAVDDDPPFERVRESLLTTADGRFGTRASAEVTGAGSEPMVVASGVYVRHDGRESLLEGPLWTTVDSTAAGGDGRWWLDLGAGMVGHQSRGADRSLRFSSLARPGWMGLRIEGFGAWRSPAPPLRAPPGARRVFSGDADGVMWMVTASTDPIGAIAAAAVEVRNDSAGRLDRLVVMEVDRRQAPTPERVIASARHAAELGFDQLFNEHRQAWAARWDAADVQIEGADDDVQAAVRFGLYHLIASVADDGEAAVGARGLSGGNYDGHVFWDADVFTLPFLAATHPAASRAMLEYRVARLPLAQAAAAGRRLAGARFPWESAADGDDVTPRFVHGADGHIVPIRAATHEEHIVADVAWACAEHIAWTADDEFARGAGRELLRETARYWASRVRLDARGVAHIYGVEGPDEYHEIVDDNAYTNVMARWNLRAAAASERRFGPGSGEAEQWMRTAAALRDGLDPATRRYEQFAGYNDLEPILIGDIAAPPVAADLLLGRERTKRTQVLKQPDVLMLHHLVPGEVAAGSLVANLDFYLPRTAHGSSLSPAVCAALLARAGRPDDAADLFGLAVRLDLDDLTGTTAGGVHLATMGGVWQTVVRGFLGVRVDRGELAVDPHLPTVWKAISANVQLRGIPVHIRATHTTVELSAESDIDAIVGVNGRTERGQELRFKHHDASWSRSR